MKHDRTAPSKRGRFAALSLGAMAAAVLTASSSAPGRADSSPSPQASITSPYARVPVPGNRVSFDGTVGGQKTAWAYFSQFWLERYLSVTVDAADFSVQGTTLESQLSTVADHVITFPNGTHGIVESILPYQYKGRLDLEVRLIVSDGQMRGKDVWTTAAELVDGAGHAYVRM